MLADSTLVQGQGSSGPDPIQETKPIAILGGKDSAADTTTTGRTDTAEERTKNSSMTQNIWIFVFRGLPKDTYHRRHTVFYLDSPDVEDFHITAHAQRPTEDLPYEYLEFDGEERYPMSVDFLHGRLVGRVQVGVSQRRKLLDVIASTPVGGEPDWNCQHFVFHALDKLTEAGIISEGRVNDTKDWMMDAVLDGAID